MTAVEVAPGVFVTQDGSARGPGLARALQLAADATTLNTWAARNPGMRRWYWQPHPAGAVELLLLNNQLTTEGRDRAQLTQAACKREGWHNCWRRAFADIHAPDQHGVSLQLAADAIRNGRV